MGVACEGSVRGDGGSVESEVRVRRGCGVRERGLQRENFSHAKTLIDDKHTGLCFG